MPITESTSAVVAKRPRTHVVKRDAEVCESTRAAIVVASNTTTEGWALRMAARTAEVTDEGATLVRISTDCVERSSAGKYRSGSAVGFRGSARGFVSPTVPTI